MLVAIGDSEKSRPLGEGFEADGAADTRFASRAKATLLAPGENVEPAIASQKVSPLDPCPVAITAASGDSKMSFLSDNTSGCLPEVLQALINVNSEREDTDSYGTDFYTKQMEDRVKEVFECGTACDVSICLVSTGTAANCLALAELCQIGGSVLCTSEAHILTDERGAPEFFGGGLALRTLPAENGKIDPDVLEGYLETSCPSIHRPTPSVLSISNSTELGTVYDVEELSRLCAIAHAHDLTVHVDGARLTNALDYANVSPAELTWKAGVDALSLGFTKAGALSAEAVLLFNPTARQRNGIQVRRKISGHLLSKHRFLACQVTAMLSDGLWLRSGRHSNAAAKRVAALAVKAGMRPMHPVQANEVFVAMSPAEEQHIRDLGVRCYRWAQIQLPVPKQRITAAAKTDLLLPACTPTSSPTPTPKALDTANERATGTANAFSPGNPTSSLSVQNVEAVGNGEIAEIPAIPGIPGIPGIQEIPGLLGSDRSIPSTQVSTSPSLASPGIQGSDCDSKNLSPRSRSLQTFSVLRFVTSFNTKTEYIDLLGAAFASAADTRRCVPTSFAFPL